MERVAGLEAVEEEKAGSKVEVEVTGVWEVLVAAARKTVEEKVVEAVAAMEEVMAVLGKVKVGEMGWLVVEGRKRRKV